MSQHLKSGQIAHIRINPGDCMGVADVIEKLGLVAERFTFHQAVRVALSSLLESARQHGVIPARDGFEYASMMERFRMPEGRVRQLQVTQLLDSTEVIRAIAPDLRRDKRRRRYEELKFLFDSDPENHPKPLPNTPEYVEWSALVDEFVEV